jgi:hypothetical protein
VAPRSAVQVPLLEQSGFEPKPEAVTKTNDTPTPPLAGKREAVAVAAFFWCRMPLLPTDRVIGGARLPLDPNGRSGFDNPFEDGATSPRQTGKP